jgi:chromosome segregation ATPase
MTNTNIDKKDEQITKLYTSEKNIRTSLQDKERVVNSFRQKCAQLSAQLQTIQSSQTSETSATEEFKNKTSHLMHTYHRLQTKLQKAKSQMWELELSEMEMRILDRYAQMTNG